MEILQGYTEKTIGDEELLKLVRELRVSWRCMESAVKPFPSRRMTHGVMELAVKMGRTAKGKEVEGLTIGIGQSARSIVATKVENKLRPANVVDAQFSIYFQAAIASWMGWRLAGRSTIV